MVKALIITVFLAATMALTGCQSAGISWKNFFGSRDPCGVAESTHAAFLVFASTRTMSAKVMSAERAGIAGVREYCAAGDIKTVQLQKIVAAYAAAVAAYKGQ